MSADEKANFLIAYDYGMGGLWGVIQARSAAEILAKYPEVSVLEVRPNWVTDDHVLAWSSPDRIMDIDAEPTSWLLKAVIADRAH